MALFNTGENKNSFFYGTLLPILWGACIAGIASIILWKMKKVWTLLVIFGLLALIPPIFMKDSLYYWFAIYIVSLPSGVHKNFGNEASITGLQDQVGLPWGLSSPILFLHDLPLLMLLLIWAHRLYMKRSSFYWPKINYIPLVLLVWCAVGALLSVHPKLTILEVIRLCKFFIVYLFVINHVDPKKMGTLLIYCLLSGLMIQGAVTIGKYKFQAVGNIFGDAFGSSGYLASADLETELGKESKKRGKGTFGHPNPTAMHFELMMPLALTLIFAGTRFKHPWIPWILFSMGLVGLYFTFSRGGMLGFMLGSLVCLALSYKRGFVSWKLIAILVLTILVSLPVAIPKFTKYLTTRVEFFEERISHWQVGAAMIQINPFMGTGLNTSTAMRRVFDYDRDEITDDFLPIHNHYLIGIIETGIIGAFLYMGFFAKIWWEAFKLSRSEHFAVRVLSVTIMSAYAGLSLHLVVDFVTADALHSYLWIYAGIIIAFRKSLNQPSQNSENTEPVIPKADPVQFASVYRK